MKQMRPAKPVVALAGDVDSRGLGAKWHDIAERDSVFQVVFKYHLELIPAPARG